MMRTASGTMLYGDWRRRMGSKTDAHLWKDGSDYAQPICGKRIEHYRTIALHSGRPCTDCLVNAIGGRDYSNAH